MTRRFAWIAAAIALSTALAPDLAAAKRPRRVEFRSDDSGRTRLDGYLYRPAGKGPFPAVVALHGCNGLFGARDRKRLSRRHRDWAGRLVDEGYVVFFPDSFSRRGIRSVCKISGRRPVTPRRRAEDANGAAAWLARRRYVDDERMALLGWSHGGTSVLWAARRGAAPERVDFRTALAFYPACRIFVENKRWQPRLPLTILIGGADDWTPPKSCRALARRFPAQITLVEYPGAHHGFDTPGQKVRPLKGLAYSAGGKGVAHSGTHPKARRAAIREVEQRLDRAFRAR